MTRAALVMLLPAVLAASGPAAAADVYLSAGIGAGHSPNEEISGASADVDFDLGKPIGSIGIGLATARGWRFALDAAYRSNDLEVVFFDDGRDDLAPDTDSLVSASSLDVIAIYEFDVGRGFRPYLGAGLGIARVDYEAREFITEALLLDDDDTRLAYQLVAGFAVTLSPRFDLGVDYRYWRVPGLEFEDDAGMPLETDYTVHSAMLGLRYFPGAARAPAAAREVSPNQGWYLHAMAGPARAKDAEIKNNIANFDAFDIGGAFAVSAGYAFGERWRVEVEGARRSNEAELVDFNPEFGEDRADGRVRADSLMVNVAYEPHWGSGFRPYVGLGAGLAWSDWDVRLNADDSVYVDDEDSAAAFQLMLGLTAELTQGIDVTAEYRFWKTGLYDLEEPDGRPMRTEQTVSTLMLGLRFHLGG